MVDAREPVRNFMTPSPRTVAPATALSDARNVMAQEQIRHLPVVEGHRLVGVVSARDVLVVEDLRVFASYDTTVEAAMAADPISVSSDTPIGHVVKTMAKEDIGCVLVVDAGKLDHLHRRGRGGFCPRFRDRRVSRDLPIIGSKGGSRSR
jgi:CBS domain-containing protein